MIYQNDITEIRLNTGLNLDGATVLKMKVQKPSGTAVEWTASRYVDEDGIDTAYITYTTDGTDLDEIGEYILHCYVEWDGVPAPLGDANVIEVVEIYTIGINVPQLVDIFKIYYNYIDVQTFEEYNIDENTDADISYEYFETYSELADDELGNLLDARRISLTSTQEKVALCHLIADYIEMSNSDWNFRSQSMGSGVSFSRGEKTAPRDALTKLLDSVELAMKANRRPSVRMGASDIKQVKDSTHYPRRFRRTAIPTWNFTDDGFDSAEVPDTGDNYDDRTY